MAILHFPPFFNFRVTVLVRLAVTVRKSVTKKNLEGLHVLSVLINEAHHDRDSTQTGM